MKTKFLLILAIVITSITVNGQIFPENGAVFIDTEIPVINITIDADSLNELLAPGNEYSDHEYPVSFNFESSEINETYENVGFRLRGNTSRVSAKKSFKISFNSFSNESKFYGLEKLNINGEHNDPSIIRSKLGFDLFRNAEVSAPRSNHVELYINGEYKGLYINVEHIDEEFIESRFANKNGNLYKCLWPATLEYLGNDPDLYKFTHDGRRVYELKTNTETDDYTNFAEFIDILNNTPIDNLHLELESIFNVNAYLRSLAIEILIGHWDSYSFNKNNFYLYDNPETGKFEFIPYDVDNTFGIDWFGIDWAIRNIYTWAESDRPLTNRLLQNQVYKDRFSFYMNQIISEYFNTTTIFPKIDNIKTMITTSAENDTYRTMDYGWTIDDFNNSYTQALGDHVTYGVKPYIGARCTSALNQLILNSISPIISQVTNNNLYIDNNLDVFARVEDEDSELNVNIFYQINDGEFISIPMLDDGVGNDEIMGDKIYSVSIYQPLSEPGIVNYYISATDTQDNTTVEPFFGYFNVVIPEHSNLELYINEFMASNSETIMDNYDEYDDWVEIYNGGSDVIWLGDKYLSDDLTFPSKWQMPDININPGEFLLFWADNDTEQGDMHACFKLSADGEEIGIFDNEASSFAQIDFVQFDAQNTDVSSGRLPNGTGPIQVLAYATPGYSNLANSIENIINDNVITIYPNPVANNIFVVVNNAEVKNINLSIINILGKSVFYKAFNINSSSPININLTELNLASGIYLINIKTFDINGIQKNNTNNKVIFK